MEVVLTHNVSCNGGETAVALDVLRATTTIVTALENGAREIIPADGKGDAIRLREGGDALLAGEWDSWRPEGFDLGNSPLEFTKERVRGERIVLVTTNGTRLLRRIAGHQRVLIGALRNAAAVAGAIAAADDGTVRIFCAGRRGQECFEDNLAAGAIVSHLLEAGECSLDGNAEKVLALFVGNKDVLRAAVMACEHGKRLAEKGFGEDVEFCSRLNVSSTVPVFDGKKICVAK